MPSRPKLSRSASAVHLRLKLWVEIGGEYVFGRGIRDILQAVGQTGSIKHAARKVGKSYRFVWAKVKETEESLGASLVTTHVGGKDTSRSELTALARELVADFDAIREEVLGLVERLGRERVGRTLEKHRRRGG